MDVKEELLAWADQFENDHYMGGNPWVIANLWMANYYLETGENKKGIRGTRRERRKT